MENKLLEYFEVGSYDELMDYMKNNPDSEKVKSLQEILDYIESIEKGEVDER